jgi:hypothetical protein
MSEFQALLLVFLSTLLVEGLAIMGLKSIHANHAALSLGVIVPLIVGSHISSRVVMRYGGSRRRQH